MKQPTGTLRNTAGYEKYQYNEETVLYSLKETGKHYFFFFTGKLKDFNGLRSATIKEIQVNVSR